MTVETTQDRVPSPSQGAMVRVWSPLIRIGHWTLVTAFVVAYLTGDDVRPVHVWAGYAAAVAVLVRIVWGFVGPEQDRFAHFLRPPGDVLRYLRDAVRLRSPRSLGHSPAGGAMTVALLLSLAATTATGLVTLAQAHNAGPLAPWFGQGAGQASLLISPARADDDDDGRAGGVAGEAEGKGEGTESAFKDVHEVLANLTLVFALLHIGGVALASFSHRENLVRSMVTGRKRAEPT
jgi:cytochrome b